MGIETIARDLGKIIRSEAEAVIKAGTDYANLNLVVHGTLESLEK
jgi:hypothetical protein